MINSVMYLFAYQIFVYVLNETLLFFPHVLKTNYLSYY